MNNRRICDELNPFGGKQEDKNSAHAFQLRGKYIFQSVPRKRTTGFGPSAVRWVLGATIAAAFLAFLGFQVFRVAAPPRLTIVAPIEGQATADPQVVVTGFTEPETAVEINGQQVFSKPDGSFAQPVELQYGANQIFVKATKKHGLFTTLSRTIMLKSPEGAVSPVSLSPVSAPSNPLN